ncbi:hypothetical protein BDZ97DRAFT_771053 [Flammula alnicola]|nr:hypothetical protein BDZ97DRAFT_771053 [Flammula alnicola]
MVPPRLGDETILFQLHHPPLHATAPRNVKHAGDVVRVLERIVRRARPRRRVNKRRQLTLGCEIMGVAVPPITNRARARMATAPWNPRQRSLLNSWISSIATTHQSIVKIPTSRASGRTARGPSQGFVPLRAFVLNRSPARFENVCGTWIR